MPDASVATHKDLSERTLGVLLLLPAALLLMVIVVYPIATLFWNSLHSTDPANPQAGELFVGLDNYARAFADDRFWSSTLKTVLYVVVTVPGALLVGLGLALLPTGLLLGWKHHYQRYYKAKAAEKTRAISEQYPELVRAWGGVAVLNNVATVQGLLDSLDRMSSRVMETEA